MKRLKFYTVDENYINELQKIDNKVPNITYSTNNKLLCGVVLKIGKLNYFAPLSSSINKHHSFLVKNNTNNSTIACIKFLYMIPVPAKYLTLKDFKNETNSKYKALLIKENNYCNEHQDKILKLAKSVYKKSLIKGTWLSNNTVDFKKLEKYALDIIQENQNKLLSDNNNQAPDIKIINPQIKM